MSATSSPIVSALLVCLSYLLPCGAVIGIDRRSPGWTECASRRRTPSLGGIGERDKGLWVRGNGGGGGECKGTREERKKNCDKSGT